LLKHEPSAHKPCANTMLVSVFVDIVGAFVATVNDFAVLAAVLA
jgi:hypothetical protein